MRSLRKVEYNALLAQIVLEGMPIVSRDARTGADDDRLTLKLVTGGLAGLTASALAIAVALSGDHPDTDVLVAVGRGVMVAIPIAVGLWAWHKRPQERFGRLLVAAGFAWSLTTLAESSNDFLYSTGRVAGWVVQVGLVYLVLAFPTGRLTQAVDRKLVWSAAVLVGGLYLLTVPFIESYPTPSPYASCHETCPPNAFLLGGSEPQFIDSVIEPLRDVLTVLLFFGVTARLAGRWQASSGLMRRTLGPVLMVASVTSVALAVGLGAVATSESQVPGWLSWTIALAVPAVALAFLLGLLSSRLHSARALERLGADVRAHLTPAKLRRQLADALEDPSLRLFLRVGVNHQAWVDELGVSVAPPQAGVGQHLTEVRDGDRVVGVIVHDAALRHDRDFLRAVASFAVIALMNEQLTETVASALRDVRESRARIVASGDRERKRIERDLHDGAQQRLVALRVQLELTEELVKNDRPGGLAKLHSLGPEVDATLDDIRALARGVYPPLLADRGLADALGAAALKLSLPTTVSPDGAAGRYPSDVESAIFFCCLEAMQNASKHAHGAHHVDISLSQEDAIRFEVKDDGAGFDIRAIQAGLGLTNMTDRIAAVGGKLTITSTPGQGTVVSGTVPLTAAWAHQNGKEEGRP